MTIVKRNFQESGNTKEPRIFITWYGNRYVPTNALKEQISTSCPAGMKDDMDVFFRSLYPDFNSMVKAHKDGNIDDSEYIRRYVSSIIKPNKETILKNVEKLKEMAAEKGVNVYMFCWCAPGKFCHRYIVRDFLRQNGIECSEPLADLLRCPGGELVLPAIHETNSSIEAIKGQEWARYSQNGYEVSSRGDKRFSAFFARFAEGSYFAGHDVSGKTVEEVYQTIVKGYPDIKSGKGKKLCRWSPVNIIYRGYATDEKEESTDLKKTVAKTASDYLEGIKANYHFTTDRWEAEQYAESHADQSEELTEKRNRHFSGTYPHVSTYILKPGVPFITIENLHDFNRNKEKLNNKSLVILKRGTLTENASEFVLKNGMENNVIKLDKTLGKEEMEKITFSWYKKIWELWASQNPSLLNELDRLTEGKTLTDMFASGNISQARALADILKEKRANKKPTEKKTANNLATKCR